jgi:hypothetical protein
MRIILLLHLCFIGTFLKSQDIDKVAVDSLVRAINLSNPKLKLTFSPGKSSKKADSIEYYYADQSGRLVKFENANIVHAKFGRIHYLSQSTFYFYNDTLIKVEILRSFPDKTKSFSEFYTSPEMKHSKKERKLDLFLIEKSNSIIKVFYNSP